MYIDKLDDIVTEYNNTYCNAIKMKPVDRKPSTYIDSSKKVNYQDSNWWLIRISKQKNIFAKGYVPNWSEEVFVIRKVKNTVRWRYVIGEEKGEEIAGTFYKKNCKKTNQN